MHHRVCLQDTATYCIEVGGHLLVVILISIKKEILKMEIDNMTSLEIRNALLTDMQNGINVAWRNPSKIPYAEAIGHTPLGRAEVFDARLRLKHFAPLLVQLFPETAKSKGRIESELREIDNMRVYLNGKYNAGVEGRLFIKMDGELPIAGSIKARGGVYEVLCFAEKLALEHDILSDDEDDYTKLATPLAKDVFSKYTIQVGSTGNLGLSVGIMGRALGFNVIVHMSSDAKEWKKELLKSKGAVVVEYEGNYSEAVAKGREAAAKDEFTYFVDDEHSQDLLLGYAAAASYIKKQLRKKDIQVDSDHPLIVYIPCGVGGAPAGITLGLKLAFGDNVHCFFVEPVNAPCMLLGMVTGMYDYIKVQDVGLSGKTEADGLAVGRVSGLASRLVQPFLSGEFTVHDRMLNRYLRALWNEEKIFIEPSSCAAFEGVVGLHNSDAGKDYISRHKYKKDNGKHATHIIWATGGGLVPEEIRNNLLKSDD